MELIKITPDKERAKNILKMISLLEERISVQDDKKMASLIISDYYEIVKELVTAILLIDGYKTLSHKDLFDYLKENYKNFNSYENEILDNLRVLRNRVSYEGFFIEPAYLNRNKSYFNEIIKKLKSILNNKIKEEK